MRINKTQGALILGGILLIQICYFGFDTVQLDKDLEAPGTETVVDEDHRVEEALTRVSGTERDSVEAWMNSGENIHSIKQLASFWVSKGEWVLAGRYAEKLAETQSDSENWEMAANTCAMGADRTENPKDRTFLSQKALSLYDKAIELNPDAFDLELKKSLLMIAHPVGGNPMGGIQALVALSEKYPDQPEVFFHLNKFAVQTGQWEKARERLENAYELDPQSMQTICMLTQVYKQVGPEDKFKVFEKRCNQ